MKIKLSSGKPRGNGLFLVHHKDGDYKELVIIEKGWMFDYPYRTTSVPVEDTNIYGYKKIDIESPR